MKLLHKKKFDFYFNLILIVCWVIFSILILSSCSNENFSPSGENENECNIKATVIKSDNEGCMLLLRTEQGSLLNPFPYYRPEFKEVDDFVINKMREGMKVKVGFEDALEICVMCENARNVRIKCIQEINSSK